GEGFANSVGEAMACEVPCVVTDVGDSAYIVGDTGLVVPPNDAEAFGRALGQLIELGNAGRQHLGRSARLRIESKFSLATVVQQFEQVYRRPFARAEAAVAVNQQ